MYKLMVVDDSAIVRNRIVRALPKNKFSVVAKAQNGIEALKFCRELMPDVVTLDLTMPRMTGLDCIPNLINLKPDIQILVVSALADKTTGIKALELGANGVLNKPFTNNDLIDALNELMEG